MTPVLSAEQAVTVASWRSGGLSWQACAVRLGRNEASLRRAMKRFDVPGLAANDDMPPTTRSAREEEAPVAVRVPMVERAPLTPPPRPSSDLEKILVIPDTHVPFEDGAAFAVMMSAARLVRPSRVVIMGDFADCEAVSFHPKGDERGMSFKEEVAAVNSRLDEIQGLGAKVTFISGNHEFRIARYLRDRAPELAGFINAQGLYNIQERGWGWVPYQDDLKIGKMHFTHDIGRAGMNAHRESRREYEGNVWIAHTHRYAVEICGTSKGPAHIGIMCGWLGDKRKISYMHKRKADQWTLGFGLAYHEQDTGHVHCVPVPIVDYRCVVEGIMVDPLKGTSADKRVA